MFSIEKNKGTDNPSRWQLMTWFPDKLVDKKLSLKFFLFCLTSFIIYRLVLVLFREKNITQDKSSLAQWNVKTEYILIE